MILIGRQLDFTLGRGERKRRGRKESESDSREPGIGSKPEKLRSIGNRLEEKRNTDNKWSAVTRCAVVRTQCLSAIPVVKRKVPRQRVADNFDTISGGHNEGVPPVPIPNTEVKPFSAEST